MRVWPYLLVATLLSSGCYSWAAIKPTELPKLNGSSTTSTAGGGHTLVLQTVAQVEAPDGRIVEVKGESDARVTTVKPPQVLSFEHPVVANLTDDSLIVQAGNVGKTTIPLSRIESVEISQLERGQTALAATVVGLLVSVVGTVLIISLVK
jgi:hypothetical protein